MKFWGYMIVATLASGCATKWNQYDQSQYRVAMEPGRASYETHVELLTEWSSEKEGLPPGLAGELGFYLGLLGRVDEARVWFDREVAAYPESEAFVGALRAVALPPDDSNSEPAS